MATQHPGRKRTLSLLVLAGLFLAGCSGDDIVDPEVDRTAIQGIVAGEDGNAYPSVTVALRHAGSAADLQSKTTGFNGSYEFTNLAAGSYEVALEPPRASEVVSTNPAAVTVAEGTTARADITIRPPQWHLTSKCSHEKPCILELALDASAGGLTEALEAVRYFAGSPTSYLPACSGFPQAS